ncbi:MAG: type II toxin-antitoxin system RelE/ParE family toxin [Lachnospiraceae bacterium]|nr:type II toxin-antitoxin system RelE/ParE family toxin [Lachnospiraceae bacterium]
MYHIAFYETANGHSDVREYLDLLLQKAKTDKDARIQYKQMARYIQLLQDNGTNLPAEIVKYLADGIWELRPGNNRIFFFFYDGCAYVLLHHYRKKSQKTPAREIQRAKSEKKDYILRKEQDQ